MTISTLVLAAAAVVSANFSETTGRIRPALHSSGFGPTICSQTKQDLDDVKAMGFDYARTHDWALINPNQRVCDYFHIFPLMHLDPADPKNYVFGPTDYLLKRTREEAGLKVFFRLGTSIEHSGKKVHFNALVPEDFDRVAETFAATIRHYTRGWANGYQWDIKYWEIWNEPEGIENMWFPAGGIEGLDEKSLIAKRAEMREQFAKFYALVLKRLKSEFGDTVKVGGPALASYNEEWLRAIFNQCRAAGVKPDFISWHGYINDPMQFNREAEQAVKLCAEYGFNGCELIVNEWHYFGYSDYSWDDMQRCSDPKVKAKIWTGPRSHNGIAASCFTLATLANMQRSKLDQAYFYGCRHTGSWGFKDELQAKYKVFYALKLFGDFIRRYPVMCASAGTDQLTTLAAKSEDGSRHALLVIDYAMKKELETLTEIAVKVAGLPADAAAKVTVLDDRQDLGESAAKLENGELKIRKADVHAAAYLVEW